jgi:predicted transcriptional regulator
MEKESNNGAKLVTTVKLDPDVREGLERLKKLDRRSRSWLVNELCREGLERRKAALNQ